MFSWRWIERQRKVAAWSRFASSSFTLSIEKIDNSAPLSVGPPSKIAYEAEDDDVPRREYVWYLKKMKANFYFTSIIKRRVTKAHKYKKPSAARDGNAADDHHNFIIFSLDAINWYRM